MLYFLGVMNQNDWILPLRSPPEAWAWIFDVGMAVGICSCSQHCWLCGCFSISPVARCSRHSTHHCASSAKWLNRLDVLNGKIEKITGLTLCARCKDWMRQWAYCAWPRLARPLRLLVIVLDEAASRPSSVDGNPMGKACILGISWNLLSRVPLLEERNRIQEACCLTLIFIYLF